VAALAYAVAALAPSISTIFATALMLGSVAAWVWLVGRSSRGLPVLPYEFRSRVPWQGLDVALAFAAALLTQAVVVQSMVGQHGPKSPDSPILVVGGMVVGTVVAIGVILALLVYRAKASWIDLGFNTAELPQDIARGAVAFLLAFAPVMLIQFLLVQVFESRHPLLELVNLKSDTRTLLLATWLAVIVMPLFEELLFRVVFQGWLEARERAWRRRSRRLRRVRSGVIPIGLSSLAFGLAHLGNGPDPVALFVLALFLGYLYRQTHRIFPSLVLHMCFNGATMALLWLERGAL